MPRGRKPTTGRYDTREELEYWVRRWDAITGGMIIAQVARLCGISQETAANILNKQDGEQHGSDREESM